MNPTRSFLSLWAEHLTGTHLWQVSGKLQNLCTSVQLEDFKRAFKLLFICKIHKYFCTVLDSQLPYILVIFFYLLNLKAFCIVFHGC